MSDVTSVLLVTVILILTIILIVFSVQIFFILKDFHKSLKNLDQVLVNFANIARKMDETISSASLIGLGSKIVGSLISLIRKDEQR